MKWWLRILTTCCLVQGIYVTLQMQFPGHFLYHTPGHPRLCFLFFFPPQIPSVVSSDSNPKADCNLPMMHEEAPWPLLSRVKDAVVPLERSAFWATKGRDRLSKCDDVFWGQIGNQHAGAIPQGMKQKNAIMNKAWLSREKTDGSTSATTAKSHLSDVLSASNKGRNPVGRNQLHGKE